MSKQNRTNAVRLTRRERQVLILISQGIASKDVADQLLISKRTVDFHLGNVYQKLGVTNRLQAFRRASELGLLPPPGATRAKKD